MDRLVASEADRVDFIVLFGSMARGDFGRGSDFDVLVGLSDAGNERPIHRMQQLDVYSDGWVEPLSYGPGELERMFGSFNSIMLAALRDGVVLYDRGPWQEYRRRFEGLLASGLLIPRERGWQWMEGAYEAAAG